MNLNMNENDDMISNEQIVEILKENHVDNGIVAYDLDNNEHYTLGMNELCNWEGTHSDECNGLLFVENGLGSFMILDTPFNRTYFPAYEPESDDDE